MSKKNYLSPYEHDIECHLEDQGALPNLSDEMQRLLQAAKDHVRKKHSITLRMSLSDLEAIKLKASQKGMPYQTYINMIIHKDVNSI